MLQYGHSTQGCQNNIELLQSWLHFILQTLPKIIKIYFFIFNWIHIISWFYHVRNILFSPRFLAHFISKKGRLEIIDHFSEKEQCLVWVIFFFYKKSLVSTHEMVMIEDLFSIFHCVHHMFLQFFLQRNNNFGHSKLLGFQQVTSKKTYFNH